MMIEDIAAKTAGKALNEDDYWIIILKRFIRGKDHLNVQRVMLLLFILNILKSMLGFIVGLSLINAR